MAWNDDSQYYLLNVFGRKSRRRRSRSIVDFGRNWSISRIVTRFGGTAVESEYLSGTFRSLSLISEKVLSSYQFQFRSLINQLALITCQLNLISQDHLSPKLSVRSYLISRLIFDWSLSSYQLRLISRLELIVLSVDLPGHISLDLPEAYHLISLDLLVGWSLSSYQWTYQSVKCAFSLYQFDSPMFVNN